MASIIWLDTHTPFPDPAQAMPEGLLAAGTDLSVERLESAYRQGIFPWFNPGEPVLWWSPDPRMVLQTRALHLSHSLAKKLRQIARREHEKNPPVRIMLNTAFRQVIQGCADTRSTQGGTWIVPAMQQVYHDWHLAGRVHSIETWINGTLAGGLYGVQLGRFFFGESMFSRHTDASKIALVYLVRFLQAQGIEHIDCQQETGHLHSLGARPIPRSQFLGLLRDTMTHPDLHWTHGQLLHDGTLRPTA